MARYRNRRTHQTHAKLAKALAVYIAQLPNYRDALDADAISWLYLSAPLHDVGKVAIADTVLHKPGPLTDEEYEAMKEHTTLGRAVLASADEITGGNSFLRIANDIATTTSDGTARATHAA